MRDGGVTMEAADQIERAMACRIWAMPVTLKKFGDAEGKATYDSGPSRTFSTRADLPFVICAATGVKTAATYKKLRRSDLPTNAPTTSNQPHQA